MGELVVVPGGKEPQEQIPQEPLTSVENALLGLVQSQEIVPASSRVLSLLTGVEDASEVDRARKRLIRLGILQAVYVGAAEHLTLARMRASLQQAPASDTEMSVDNAFALELRLDREREKLLLFRVLVTFELLGLALLTREGLLWWLSV